MIRIRFPDISYHYTILTAGLKSMFGVSSPLPANTHSNRPHCQTSKEQQLHTNINTNHLDQSHVRSTET